ncbi:MAG: RNA-binding S4 domain-containing protein [Firmicutes bacterium]|uniref:RQC P-site tRNA stabilizing factor n=1 Tax=Melghirimyces thermohalophilus TaxID=1236220 RepID=A0A1G6Q1H1_9BACL|nr:RNA-binding S4 domain-containing protein [Melghirimyces thermohalophilus]MDA8353118.1 RNA-binding S4 domain-containing protein [Bacillota bacterium]SDC86290.1 Ribosomal 50S subunit-recycling heat shock protein, contains S4 domain [Melghirimyces thermohalophilus]
MRLDKFLKASRLVKRRTLAKEVCDQGRVEVNGRPAKAGTVLAVNDEVLIRFGNRRLRVRVDSLKETTRKSEAGELYTMLEPSSPDDAGHTGS